MANIDVDFGMAPRARPAAIVQAHRGRAAEARPTAARGNKRSRYSRIDAGQLARAVFLALLFFGAFHILHPGASHAAKTTTGAIARQI